MGQGMSCTESRGNLLFSAVQNGELRTVEAIADANPTLLTLKTDNRKLSAMHVAAANGQIEVLSMLLHRTENPDIFDRHKQILLFDTLKGRTCLHYAAYYGHSDCLESILSAANSTAVAHSWGFSRFVNIRDKSGATPLHLAACQNRSDCVRILLSRGALVCASTGGYTYSGNTPIHLAARGGSLDCVRELLSWGADRLQRDTSGRIPYMIALKHKHDACAALLNPLAPELLTWPFPLKFISELNPEAKSLLENALVEANKNREKAILGAASYSVSPLAVSDDIDESEAISTELCCICFELACTVEVENCGHKMCAHCILALCCHNKPNASTNSAKIPVCPFCRSSITRLVIAKNKSDSETEWHFSPRKLGRTRETFNPGEGSRSFNNLSPFSSFGRLGRSLGKVSTELDEELDKP
ncbi:putative E3 ubiquitin-protein ligase XBAT31 isoform X2 [Primulina eburnea]|uniref:putative E3 ubiquitin-protein ligase XBAT31 isoform X2 n=1 Tax=Primulina eburnea TaxID=1245227 RepID=UPI003C6C587B